jgi:hypothetical protein
LGGIRLIKSLPQERDALPVDPSRKNPTYLTRHPKVAGEVRFVKDRSGDKSEWGWGPTGPAERSIDGQFIFNAKHLKPLALTLRSSLMALGHVASAYTRFTKIKSSNVSPDGNLGGKGYIQKISDMRRQLVNCVEALSSLTDTIYDELSAPHWNPAEDTMTPRDRAEVKEIVQEAEDIKDDPEAWAQEEEEDASPTETSQKTASDKRGQVTRSLRFIRAAASSGCLTSAQVQRLARDLARIERSLVEQR